MGKFTEQNYYERELKQKENTTISPATNSHFAKAGVSYFYENEVLNSSFVHLIKFSDENPRLRKEANRYQQL